ncbi:MAG: glutaredoxin 2 [Bdellovibrionales bacterium]|nr:glutaredoxin 2 [Bdellovibrionales bacterium]
MKLFIYDHCPYCVKARMIFGLKKVPFELVTLLNDDENTPIKMIGQKMVPILEIEPGQFMPESMDIVKFIDKKFPPVVVTEKENPSLLEILDQARIAYYSLVMPRWINSRMEEFKTPSAKQYFQKKKENMIGPFFSALENTENFKKEIIKILQEIEKKMAEKNQWYLGDKISFNDFHLFAFLRSLTIVKGLPFPPKLKRYVKNCAHKSQIPLSYKQALV